MTRVEKSVLVMHSAHEMWELVEDIPAYPQFLPWCSGAEVHQRENGRTVATLHINFHGLRQQFTTRNTSIPDHSLRMELVEGPFQHLQGEFHFVALQENACKVSFSLEWTFSSRLLEKVVGPVFHRIANSMVDAFVARAEVVHGTALR
jgi:ribosome-associated toxin RatA of RatAB toxin-antitoxin module